jgi:hypothetical protein
MKESIAIDLRTSEVVSWLTSQEIKKIESVDASKYTAPLDATFFFDSL